MNTSAKKEWLDQEQTILSICEHRKYSVVSQEEIKKSNKINNKRTERRADQLFRSNDFFFQVQFEV